MAIPAVQIDELFEDGRPDWGRIEFEIYCSRCDYNLRMLERARCPECGLEFDWRTMLEIAATGSDFLFEHHWRKRSVGSFVTTVRRSFSPKRFWASVSMHERICLGPLAVMFFLGMLCFSIVLHTTALLAALLLESTATPSGFGSKLGRLSSHLRDLGEVPWTTGSGSILFMLPPLLTLLGAFGLLLLLRETLGRCRVRNAQVFRVIAYVAVPVAVWSALTALVGSCVMVLVPSGFSEWILGLAPGFYVMLAMMLLIGVILTQYLTVGLRDYLMLPRPRILAATAALVGLLFMPFALLLLARLLPLY